MGKDRGRGGQERPEEEDYCSRPPAPDLQEDTQEADGRKPSDKSRRQAPSQHKETKGTVCHSSHTNYVGTTGIVRTKPQENGFSTEIKTPHANKRICVFSV